MLNSQNIVVFTSRLEHAVRRGIAQIDDSIEGLSWLIVVHTPIHSPRRLVRKQWRNLRHNGWRWIPYQAVDAWQRLSSAAFSVNTHSVFPDHAHIMPLEERTNFQALRIERMHSIDTLDMVSSFNADLGLSLAAPVLLKGIFDTPRLGTLNLHKGKVPDYRGMPPGFWELWNDEDTIGCTVHWIDASLDTGDVVCRDTIKRQRFSTLRGLQLTLDDVGVNLMRDAVSQVLGGSAVRCPQADKGRTYRKPTLVRESSPRNRMRKSQPQNAGVLVRGLKPCRTELGLTLQRFHLRKLLAPRVKVILYHRSTDDARDNLTLGIEQFDRQMVLLRKFCVSVSIKDLLNAPEIPVSRLSLVAVTFDDGYLYNYAHAVPILMRHQIPAIFHVSTGIVETDKQFRHDIDRGNRLIATMNWDHLRAMRDWGFKIGYHSMTHIDCAKQTEANVREELDQSRDMLAAELGGSGFIFAYSYGGRQHMTQRKLQLVKRAGYIGCLSTYGGTNIVRVDPFNVLRSGINGEFGRAYIECVGLR